MEDEEPLAPQDHAQEKPARRWPLFVGAAVISLALLFGPGLIRHSGSGGLVNRQPAPKVARPSDLPGWEIAAADEYAALPPSPDASDPGLDATGAEPAEILGAGSLSSAFECIIEPYELVELGSPVRGVIEELPFDRSDRVEAGQIVAKLESGVERAAVELARARASMDGVLKAREANLSLGDRRESRARKLYARKALSQDQMDQANTEAIVARLELEQAREQRRLAALQLKQAREAVERRMIHSPISGVVVERLMAEGETVDEEKILTIAQLDPLRVEVILPSAIFGTVQPGMRASITPEFASGQLHVAEVTIVDRVIDPASGTFGVRLELPNPKHAIPSGLHCQVRFLTE